MSGLGVTYFGDSCLLNYWAASLFTAITPPNRNNVIIKQLVASLRLKIACWRYYLACCVPSE